MDETFTLLPLHMDPATKLISAPSLGSDAALAAELEQLNTTHQNLKALDDPRGVPPPPLPLNPKRSAAIQKMREQGNAAMGKKGGAAAPEAHKLYTYAVEMALKRPHWEPAGIVRDELAALLSNRAQAHIALQQWPEGAVDALTSVDLKAGPGQGKAWWRRARCLLEMGRLQEALDWTIKGLEVEGTGEGAADLRGMRKTVEDRLEREGKSAE